MAAVEKSTGIANSGFWVLDAPSARRFPFALGGDGIGAPGQNPKFEFRLLTEQSKDFGDVVHVNGGQEPRDSGDEARFTDSLLEADYR
jgi:hypothetical protein